MIPYAGHDGERTSPIFNGGSAKRDKPRIRPHRKWKWGGAMASRADQLSRRHRSTVQIAKEMKIEEHEAEYLVNLGRAFRRKLPNPYRGQE